MLMLVKCAPYPIKTFRSNEYTFTPTAPLRSGGIPGLPLGSSRISMLGYLPSNLPFYDSGNSSNQDNFQEDSRRGMCFITCKAGLTSLIPKINRSSPARLEFRDNSYNRNVLVNIDAFYTWICVTQETISSASINSLVNQ